MNPQLNESTAIYTQHTHSDFGQVFCNVGVYEMQQSASVAFTNFGLAHKQVCRIHYDAMHTCVHVRVHNHTCALDKQLGFNIGLNCACACACMIWIGTDSTHTYNVVLLKCNGLLFLQDNA